MIGKLELGFVPGKLRDYCSGHIESKDGDLLVKEINGTFMGYLDFDG